MKHETHQSLDDCFYRIIVEKVADNMVFQPGDDLTTRILLASNALRPRVSHDVSPERVILQIMERYEVIMQQGLANMSGLFDEVEWMLLLDLVRSPGYGTMEFDLTCELLKSASVGGFATADNGFLEDTPQIAMARKLGELASSQHMALMDALERARRVFSEKEGHANAALRVGLILKEHRVTSSAP